MGLKTRLEVTMRFDGEEWPVELKFGMPFFKCCVPWQLLTCFNSMHIVHLCVVCSMNAIYFRNSHAA